jgi:8-oxo-dGTP diphosphatase
VCFWKFRAVIPAQRFIHLPLPILSRKPMMKTIKNKYDGITVDYTTLPDTNEVFHKEIIQLIESFKDKRLLWIKIPIEKSDFIPILTNLDFEFHHCDEKNLMLVKSLIQSSVIPTANNYTVGVGAVVRDGNQLLVIKERFSNGYKLPGGHVDNNELIKDALKREVYEETGIKVEFESIVNLGHFTKGQFNESNLYVVCTAKALTKEITIHDSSEIVEAKWMAIDEFLNLKNTNNYNKNVVKATIENKDLKLTDQPLKLKVTGEVFF